MLYLILFVVIALLLSYYLGHYFTKSQLNSYYEEKLTLGKAENETLKTENQQLKQDLADLKYQYKDLEKTLNYQQSREDT